MGKLDLIEPDLLLKVAFHRKGLPLIFSFQPNRSKKSNSKQFPAAQPSEFSYRILPNLPRSKKVARHRKGKYLKSFL